MSEPNLHLNLVLSRPPSLVAHALLAAGVLRRISVTYVPFMIRGWEITVWGRLVAEGGWFWHIHSPTSAVRVSLILFILQLVLGGKSSGGCRCITDTSTGTPTGLRVIVVSTLV